MQKMPRSRRLFALAAAYAIALQALLLPLSVAGGAVSNSSLCMAASSATAPQPDTGHSTGCPCAAGCGMQCCSEALAGAPQFDFVVARIFVRAAPPPRAFASIARPYVRSPQLARAPPAV